LFSGCSRDLRNDDGHTARDIFELNESLFSADEAKKISYILTKPKPCSCLRLTRPIEKVTKSRTTQCVSILVDTIVLLLFAFAAIFSQSIKVHESNQQIETILIAICTGALSFSIIFYILCLINPGYVASREDFIKILERMLNETLHLDYVCIQCENLRPEQTRHCNYCNKCVQGFDHHCTFINNCVGYRNHKYFILFLVFFAVYMFSLIVHTAFAIVLLLMDELVYVSWQMRTIKIAINSFIVLAVLLHSPILCL